MVLVEGSVFIYYFVLFFILEPESELEDDEDKDINTVVTPKSVDNLMDHFRNWLTSVDGRHKSERVALQRSRQVLGILKKISSGKYNPKDLFNKSLLRDHWLTKFGKNAQPGN